MRKSNAQRQRAYRDRHLKFTDEPDDLLERINQMVSLPAKNTLKRLASYYGVTQRAILESAIANAERTLFDTLPGEQQNDYYDMNITLRSNRKKEASNNRSLTDRTRCYVSISFRPTRLKYPAIRRDLIRNNPL